MDIGWPEILIIAVVILVLFGSRKMPDAARSLGRSLRILKTEVKGLHDDDDESAKPPADAPSTTNALPPGQSATTPATTAPDGPVGPRTTPEPDRPDVR